MKLLLIVLGLSLIMFIVCVELLIYEFQFDNGFDVLVCEDYWVLVIIVMVWFKVGSIDEVFYEIGLVYVFEYMMFKGSKWFDVGEFLCIVVCFGGSDNVFISYDFIVYFQQYEVLWLLLVLELEVECLKNLKIDDELFCCELQVVMEECCQCIDDKFMVLVWEKFQVVVWFGIGYVYLIIGWCDLFV